MSEITWTLSGIRTGPHILARVGLQTDTTQGQVGELLLAPEAYADLAIRLDAATCATCGQPLPTIQARQGFTDCEGCDPLQMPATALGSERVDRVMGMLDRLRVAVTDPADRCAEHGRADHDHPGEYVGAGGTYELTQAGEFTEGGAR